MTQSDNSSWPSLSQRTAGVAIPLFSLRSAGDLGSGDILDLIPFIDWLAEWHHGVVQLLPINEAGPSEASPYSALSAFAIDPSYIAATQVADVAQSEAAQRWLRTPQIRGKRERLAQAAQRERAATYGFRLRLLEFGFAEFTARSDAGRQARFDAFCARQAWWLDDYALFRALKERRGFASWETWPEPLRARDPAALAAERAQLHVRVRFAQYLQWLAAEQWAVVRAHARQRGVRIMGDLPFVCSRDSADVWAHPDLFDFSGSAGAPPDQFSPEGQAWGLPLYDWAALRRSGYEWWRQRVRHARELYDLFRIDHVVGLYRTYAIPLRDGGTAGFVPREEPDQRAHGHDLMRAIVAEAAPAGVVAEDLGTVPDWVRDDLTSLGIPGYRVFRWERHGHAFIDPRTYPALSVATSGTHDTDTLLTWWDDLDTADRAAVTQLLDLDSPTPTDHCSRMTDNAPLPLLPLLRRLYDAGSLMTILPVQDLFGWPERINVPATVGGENWSYRLPAATSQLDELPSVRERMVLVRDMIDAAGRAPRPQ
jgi:4-alpha-glucanotransferase